MYEVDGVKIMDWWLEKYHNTNLKSEIENHPEWKNDSHEFYQTFKVTQEQHDEWEAWAKEFVKKELGISKKLLEHSWWSLYLDTSPTVINE